MLAPGRRHSSSPTMPSHLRIARPVTDLDRAVRMYVDGLGLQALGGFRDHEGFDGVMLGEPGADHHFEFTVCRHHPVQPAPTPEDLLVVYVPDREVWTRRCAALLSAGFRETPSFNPYWDQRGRTFVDADGYRLVVERDSWSADDVR